VQKTRLRQIVSLTAGRFEAQEVIRADHPDARPSSALRRSPELARIVPPGGTYAYDLIAFVGVKTFLENQTLLQVKRQLLQAGPQMSISTSTLHDQKLKFLFYLQGCHHHARPALREHCRQQNHQTWCIDGTVEGASPVFLGIKMVECRILLECRKVASENQNDVEAFLRQTAELYGPPQNILHDLSGPISAACAKALPEVPHHICHYHLASDVGKDLFREPQAQMNKHLQRLKIWARLKEQRRSQTETLRKQFADSALAPALQSLLQEARWPASIPTALGREAVLGLHQWLLDYRHDGNRQGFPFDPYCLYQHRRFSKAHAALSSLKQRPASWRALPPALHNLFALLQEYCGDAGIVQSAELYEKAYRVFERFRAALRLQAQGDRPMREEYVLDAAEQEQVCGALSQLREDCREQIQSAPHPHPALYRIVLRHLDKYWDRLGLEDTENRPSARTTNSIETHWTQAKRACRKTHGRSHLGSDFSAMPAALMLIPNLSNPDYLELVLDGSLDNLGRKFAEVPLSQNYRQWRIQQKPGTLTRLPRSLVRDPSFLEKLTDCCSGLAP
jgi:hypothetical protein